jgi:DNA polymerase
MTLEELHKECKKCERCRLREYATQVVPGEGSSKAEIVFIGEAPGENEDKDGRPFCGAAGRLLDELLSSIGMKRDKVFITNMVKCRPPKNRDPLEDELKACEIWLNKQLEIIKPRIIVTLGRYSMARFLPGTKISEVHGKVFENPPYIIIPLYHPAVALYNSTMRKTLQKDFHAITDYQKGKVKPLSLKEKLSEIQNLLMKNSNTKSSQISLF